MSDYIIDGTWEERIQRQDLRGRRVRVLVMPEVEAVPPPAGSEEDPWLRRLREWAGSHPTCDHFVDFSRESIYSGTVDDPR